MRYYIPPKTNETDAEFWARMAKMAEGADEAEAAEARCQHIPSRPVAVLGPCVSKPAALVEHCC